MKIFVAILLGVMMGSSAAVQIIRNRKHRESADRKKWISACVMSTAALVPAASLAFGTDCGPWLISGMIPSLLCMYMLTTSLAGREKVSRWVTVPVYVNVLITVYPLLCLMGYLPVPSDTLAVAVAVMSPVLPAACFLVGLFLRVRDIKRVMKTGTVWAGVSLGVDALYLLTQSAVVMMYMGISFLVGSFYGIHAASAAVMLALELVAYGYRILTDSAFVLWGKQEQRIVESLKVTSVESATDMSRIDIVYKEIYERVVAYFEREKPFLNCELTINDLVKVLYSNKLYISKAISQFTGRNFCQFVNYYRIMYSIECFKANHDLKIHEMSSMSGFNSIVSFNMAFRLYMGENPSDWCRKEKGRFVKGKK